MFEGEIAVSYIEFGLVSFLYLYYLNRNGTTCTEQMVLHLENFTTNSIIGKTTYETRVIFASQNKKMERSRFRRKPPRIGPQRLCSHPP